MLKLEDKETIYCDVDGTLVLHQDECTPEQMEEFGIIIPECLIEHKSKYKYRVVPHLPHIKLLKEFKTKGKQIVVWSQGGSNWAEAVVEYLELREYVDLIINKPTWFIDDLPTNYFMPTSSRIYKTYDGSSNTPD